MRFKGFKNLFNSLFWFHTRICPWQAQWANLAFKDQISLLSFFSIQHILEFIKTNLSSEVQVPHYSLKVCKFFDWGGRGVLMELGSNSILVNMRSGYLGCFIQPTEDEIFSIRVWHMSKTPKHQKFEKRELGTFWIFSSHTCGRKEGSRIEIYTTP